MTAHATTRTNIEDSFDEGTDEVVKERVDFVRNKLLERVKLRRQSISSSICSQDSKKRKTSTELEGDPVRSRPSSLFSQKQ